MEKQNIKLKLLSKRSLARLIACQALCMYYDKNNEDKNVNSILKAINSFFVEENFLDKNNKNKYKGLCEDQFTLGLVEGVINNPEKFDKIINELLQKQDTTENLDDIILQSFRLAGFELENYLEIDKNTITNEYVDIVAEFYDGIYVKFANGILDNLANYIRDGKIKNQKKIIQKKQNELANNKKSRKFRNLLSLKK